MDQREAASQKVDWYWKDAAFNADTMTDMLVEFGSDREAVVLEEAVREVRRLDRKFFPGSNNDDQTRSLLYGLLSDWVEREATRRRGGE